MSKEIWVPKSETSASVTDGIVSVRTDMLFFPRSVSEIKEVTAEAPTAARRVHPQAEDSDARQST